MRWRLPSHDVLELEKAMKTEDEVEVLLAWHGIRAPEADLPFLRRTRRRQQDLLKEWATDVAPEAEPALTLKA